MLRVLRSLMGGGAKLPPKKQKRDEKRYQAERALAQKGTAKQRLKLASSSKTHQEILYYLAQQDPDPKVRQAVASNWITPAHASVILAKDASEDVRVALAGRLVHLLPDMDKNEHSQLYAFVVQALATLALDEVLKVRVALSSALKDMAQAPPKVAAQLARDIERMVSEPILRFCAAVPDDDLIDILKGHPASWAIEAIAGRPAVSENVSKAVVESKNVPAGKILINNDGASMSTRLLEDIIERARSCPEWHEPLAKRQNLPPSLAKDMASYVDEAIKTILQARPDFDDETKEDIAKVARRRIDFAHEGDQSEESAYERAGRMKEEGRLNEEALSDALSWRDKALTFAILAFMSGVNVADIKKVFAIGAGKPIVALSWKCKLSMRMALQLQKEVGHIQPKDLVYPKDGTDYPLNDEELKWQLNFLGL